eukprot:CAMPEP_0177606960 /NCGR_PEP_ID=MMETSP0419_2-20121207/17620_1 /TAXON_ID=582737 /ORGANISM="Tetraselmis sp., Strain GSL018" /LENGTH=291 /DNA_ID=CAMNT_0019101425 /DNA_START=240 /DNA_END=1115 /DNA_ORIENTATION=+
MVSNPEWPFRAEDSSVVTGFSSCFSLGENVRTAVLSLKASARRKTISAKQISGLYRVFQIYAASLGLMTREVVSHVEASERLAQTVFSIGASPDHGSEDKSVLDILGPLSEALWSMHLRFLYELGSYVKAPEELSEPVAAELLNKFSAGKTMATRFATISIVDYLFNLRKHVTKKDFWQLARRKIKLEQLRGFPKYRGMRLQILASLLSSIPPEDRARRMKVVAPLPLPLHWFVFRLICPVVHARGFLRPLRQATEGSMVEQYVVEVPYQRAMHRDAWTCDEVALVRRSTT